MELNSKQTPIISTDSEWDALSGTWVSTQFAYGDKAVVFLRDDLPDDIKDRLRAAGSKDGVAVQFVWRDDKTNLLRRAKKYFGLDCEKVFLPMFFSPKDLEFALGWEQVEDAIIKRKLRQRNNLSGPVGSVHVKDLYGWAGKGDKHDKKNLEGLAKTVGVPLPNKSSMDEYKKNMQKGVLERPEDFLHYSADDAKVLLGIYSSFVDLGNSMMKDVLGMESGWTMYNIPMTVGALVAKTFERWLYANAGVEYEDAFKFCIRKLGLLDPDHRQYKFSKWAYQSSVLRYRTVDQLRDGMLSSVADEDKEKKDKDELKAKVKTLRQSLKEQGKDKDEINKAVADLKARNTPLYKSDSALLRQFFKAKFKYTALDSCGIKWWADRPATDTACYNALVQGGRCLNENPFEYSIGPGLDVDISGCYGEALRHMTYPVGVPTVWSYGPNDKRITLGEWLDANEDKLVDNLWTATVSGKLSFEQDVIFSKLVKAGDIKKVVWTPQKEDTDFQADFVMLRNEIHNGMITSDVLRVLRAVATNQEWPEIRNLELVSAIAYLSSDRKDGVREWCESVLADGVYYKKGPHTGGVKESRSHVWFGVPLEGFIGKLVDERRRQQKIVDDETKSSEERAKAAGLDGMIKLMVNTLYGVEASRYFTIGNTVMGNNITARARVGVWMVAKALGLRQCITDGGIYTPGRVRTFKDRKPGLDVLSRSWEWKASNCGRVYTKMGGLDWTDPAEWTGRDVDGLAMAHVQSFWERYDLQFMFKLAHKKKNTFQRAAYWAKADYALFVGPDKEPIYAVRGKNKNRRDDRKRHPTFILLDNILAGQDLFPADLSYTKGGIMKIGKFLVVQNCNGYANAKNLRPGDNLPEETYTARYNNNHFPMADEKEYRRRRDRKKEHRGKAVRWFEKYGEKGIRAVHNAMRWDKL